MTIDMTDVTVDAARPALDFAAGRRTFLKTMSLGTIGAIALGGMSVEDADAQTINDVNIFNFALNFEYLGAEFYMRASSGSGLPASMTTGSRGIPGTVTGGRKVAFSSPVVNSIAQQLAYDEVGHVRAFRAALGNAAIVEPAIDLTNGFAMAAQAATGMTGFDPFANDENFLLGAYVLEDVCVTALHGAAKLLTSKANLDAAAGILAVEGYQAGIIRTMLFAMAGSGANPNPSIVTRQISALRARLSGVADSGIGSFNTPSLVPADPNTSIVYERTPQQVLNIAYGQQGASKGQFFPNGTNSPFNTGVVIQ